MNKEITFVIKTFERINCVKRLVRSIQKYYPNYPILIGDDSKESCKGYFKFYSFFTGANIEVVELPYDSGLSYGRNELIKRVKTEFFVLMDDDFVIDDQCDFKYAISVFESSDLDILGGYYRNYPATDENTGIFKRIQYKDKKNEKPLNYIGDLNLDVNNRILTFDVENDFFPDFVRTDVVENFFIARSASILEKCLWDSDLKVNEHLAFFFEAKAKGVKVAFSNRLSVIHRPVQSKNYMKSRNRRYFQVFMKKHNIGKIVWKHKSGKEECVYNIEIQRNNRKLYLFGAGNNCDDYLSYRDDYVWGIIDNDTNKTGKNIRGVKVISPDAIKDWHQIFIIITVAKYEDIAYQLSGYGLLHIRDYLLIGEC